MVGTGVVAGGVAGPAAGHGVLANSRPRLAHVLPDVALVASGVALFYCLFLFHGYQKLFRDSDAGWHIRTGEAILADRKLPRTDPYSFTRAGSPWFAWEWGSDVLTGAVHIAGGLPGVALVYAVAIAAGVWLWFRLHWAAGGDFLLACAMAPLLLSTAHIHWLARPHVFSWLLLLGAVWYAERAAARVDLRFGPREALAIGSFTALWANLHASFVFAPFLALLYGAAHGLRPWIWPLDRAEEWRRARWFACAALIAAAGTLLNPYGWRLHAHVLAYLGDGELLARVREFQSFDYHAAGAGQIILALGVAAAGAAAALAQRKLAHVFLAVLWLSLALRSARALPIAALLLLPLANGAITEFLQSCHGLRPALRRRLDAWLEYSARLRAIDRQCRGWLWAPVLVLAAFALLRLPALARQTGFSPAEFPVAASAAVERLPADARLLAPDKFGGYLIYRFRGERKVFFDGRSDLYGAAFLKEYARLVALRPGWQAQLDRFAFTHALLPADAALAPALEQIGWRRLYADSVAVLLARSAPPQPRY